MSLLDKKKKRKETQTRDQFFIFMGRWFERFKDENVQGCRQVEDLSEIPQEYLEDWSGWKPKPIQKDQFGAYGYSHKKSSKFF